MLAGRPAAEICPGKKNFRVLLARISQGVFFVGAVGVFAFVVEGVFSEPFKGHADHKARGYYSVGIDVVAGNEHRLTFYVVNFFECHCFD